MPFLNEVHCILGTDRAPTLTVANLEHAISRGIARRSFPAADLRRPGGTRSPKRGVNRHAPSVASFRRRWLPETNAVVNSLSIEQSGFLLPASVL